MTRAAHPYVVRDCHPLVSHRATVLGGTRSHSGRSSHPALSRMAGIMPTAATRPPRASSRPTLSCLHLSHSHVMGDWLGHPPNLTHGSATPRTPSLHAASCLRRRRRTLRPSNRSSRTVRLAQPNPSWGSCAVPVLPSCAVPVLPSVTLPAHVDDRRPSVQCWCRYGACSLLLRRSLRGPSETSKPSTR